MRADKPRRAATTKRSPRRRLRDGIILGVACSLGIGAIGYLSLSNSGVIAFASQASPAPAVSAPDRDISTSRDSDRPKLTFEELAKQRTRAIEQTGEQVEAARYQDAATTRQKELKSTAASVTEEADRLRNLARFLWPTEGNVGSPWGMRLHPILHYYRLHGGDDIGGKCGQPIYAAQSGTVDKAEGGGYNGGSGNNIRIDHGDINGAHVESAYLHMNEFVVKVGQQINKGDLVGYVGSTGLSTACHLHFSIYKNGVNSDPMEYLVKPDKQDKNAKGDENSADRELDNAIEPQA